MKQTTALLPSELTVKTTRKDIINNGSLTLPGINILIPGNQYVIFCTDGIVVITIKQITIDEMNTKIIFAIDANISADDTTRIIQNVMSENNGNGLYKSTSTNNGRYALSNNKNKTKKSAMTIEELLLSHGGYNRYDDDDDD